MSRIVRAVSAEEVSGASGIDPLPDDRSAAGLYAIEQTSRIRRNEHHLASPCRRAEDYQSPSRSCCADEVIRKQRACSAD